MGGDKEEESYGSRSKAVRKDVAGDGVVSDPTPRKRRQVLFGDTKAKCTAQAVSDHVTKEDQYYKTAYDLNLVVSKDAVSRWKGCARISRHQHTGSWKAVLFIILTNMIVFAMSASDNTVETDHFEPTGASNARELAATTTSTLLTADFESGIAPLVQGQGDHADWTRRSGGTPSSGTGPSSAHGGSHYVFFETSDPIDAGHTAVLESQALTVSSCLNVTVSFWYNMYGSTMGSLKVEVGSSTGSDRVKVFEASGDKGQTWFEFEAQIGTETAWAGSAKFFITGTDSGGYQSDMAIDDVALGCVSCGTPSEMIGLDGSTCVTSCPAGAIQNQNGTACGCAAGYGPNAGKTACEACGPGTFASAGVASCQACSAGRVQPSSGQESCNATCSAGHGPNAGKTACEACGSGTFASAGAASCQECPGGRVQPSSGQGSCNATCSDGHGPNAGKTACEACGPGTFARAGDAFCQECPAGRVQPSSEQGSCVWNCSKPGHFLDLRVRQCSPCKPGTFDPLG